MPSIGVLEHNQKPTDKPTRRVKRSGGQSLVRQGLAIWLRENVILQMRSTRCLQSTPNEHFTGLLQNASRQDNEPSQSVRMGKLRWEPPKNKRSPKAHPWQNMNPIADQRSHPAY